MVPAGLLPAGAVAARLKSYPTPAALHTSDIPDRCSADRKRAAGFGRQLGSPGGSTIPGTVLQVLRERLELGATLPEAVARPRVVQRNAATSPAEPAFISSPEGQALLARGHSYASMAEIGAVTGIELRRRGRMIAAAEPVRRGGGSAATARP